MCCRVSWQAISSLIERPDMGAGVWANGAAIRFNGDDRGLEELPL